VSDRWELLKLVTIYRLPYRDPWRRRQIRIDARKLVTCSPWPGESATADQVAQLALLRLLALQREARRATRHRLADSAALAVRNSIETYLVGMYCLFGSDPLDHLNAQNTHALKAILRYLPDEIVPKDLVATLVASLGKAERAKPLTEIAQVVDAATGTTDCVTLYEGFYAALSTSYAHGRGLALLRHVGKKGRLIARPRRAWGRRSPIHLGDALVAQFASALAEHHGGIADSFRTYAEAHRNRVITPLFSMRGGGSLSSIQWTHAPRAVVEILRLRRYVAGTGKNDTAQVRQAR
jgi:hypothetical protein